MGFIMTIINIVLFVTVGIGIYSLSAGNIIYTAIGTMILTGGASANPIFALIAYPAVEYFFNSSLTIFSYIIIGVTLLQIVLVGFIASRR